MRAEPKDSSEMISQALFGEQLELLEQQNNWFKVRSLWDTYEGWVDSKQLKNISQPLKTGHMNFQLVHTCTHKDAHIPITLGASLPNFDGMNFKLEKDKYVFSGQSIEMGIHNKKHLKKIALLYLHAPYLWGGRSPFGIDCSGFTQIVYKFLNIQLPRDAYQQAEMGATLNFVSECKLGDLAYFGDEERITHVGIMLNQTQIIHASGKVRIDTLDHVGIYNKELKKYTHKLKVIKRLFD